VAVAACLGALAPDIDAVMMPFGWDVYLRVHDVGTHTILGSVLVALAVAVALRNRLQPSTYTLFSASWLGALSHLLLDVVSGARIRLGWPLIDTRTSVPLVAMAEPWLLAASLSAAVMTALLNHHGQRAARLALGAIAIALTVKGIWLAQALGKWGGTPSSASTDAWIVEARWATLREWTVYSRTSEALTQVSIAPGRAPVIISTWTIDDEPSLVRSSRRLADVRNLLAVHELTFARAFPGTQGLTEVLWSDLRYCWRPADGNEGTVLTGPLALGAGPSRIACALWVGGTYDEAGRPIRQRVQVFGLWRSRPAQ
jgi:membrane-bound metal-dependent hydrolase YbcI (DUF457 family)